MSTPSYPPVVNRLICDKRTKTFQWEIPGCRNAATGEFLKVDVEYWVDRADPAVGKPTSVIIETTTIGGCDVATLIEDHFEAIEAAILAEIEE